MSWFLNVSINIQSGTASRKEVLIVLNLFGCIYFLKILKTFYKISGNEEVEIYYRIFAITLGKGWFDCLNHYNIFFNSLKVS